MNLDNVLTAYLECALWSSCDFDGNPLDDTFGIEDLSEEFINQSKEEIEAFLEEAGDLVEDLEDGQIGHDFWLSREGHGAGFWDRGLKETGEKLHAIAKGFGGGYDDLVSALPEKTSKVFGQECR